MGYNPVRDALIGYGFAEQQRNLEQAREQSAGRYEREQELNRRQDYEYNLARIARDADNMAQQIHAKNTDPKTGITDIEGMNKDLYENKFLWDMYQEVHPGFAGIQPHPTDPNKVVVMETGPDGNIRPAVMGDDEDPNAEIATLPTDSKYGAIRNGLQLMAGLNPEWYKNTLLKIQEKYKNQENSVLSAAMWDEQVAQQNQGSAGLPPSAGLGAATAGAPAGGPAGTPDNALLTGELDLRGAAAAGAATGASTTTQEKTAPASTKTLAEQQKEIDSQGSWYDTEHAATSIGDAVKKGVGAVADAWETGNVNSYETRLRMALDMKNYNGAQIRREPEKYKQYYDKARDRFSGEEQKKLDELFNVDPKKAVADKQAAAEAKIENDYQTALRQNDLQQARLQQRLNDPGFFYQGAQKEKFLADTRKELERVQQERTKIKRGAVEPPPEASSTKPTGAAPASTTKAKNAETVNQMMANPQQTARTNGTAAAGAVKAASTQAGYKPNSKLRAQMIKMVAEGNLSMEGVMHVLEIAKGPDVEWHTLKQGGKNAPDLLVGTVGRNVVVTMQGNNYAPTAEPLTLDDYKDINTAIATFVNQMHDKDNENGPTKQELYRNFNATIMGLGGKWQLAVLPNFQSLLAQGIELQRRMTDDNGMLPFGDTIRSGSWLPGTMATAFGLTDDPNDFLQDYWMPGYHALKDNNRWTGNPNIDEPRMYQILTNARAQVRDTGIDPQTAIRRIVLDALGIELPPEPTPTQE